jgi:hypothetical protein
MRAAIWHIARKCFEYGFVRVCVDVCVCAGYLYWFCKCNIIWGMYECLPFFPVFTISVISVMVLYVCTEFSIWFEYPELPLLFLMAWICSLYLILNILPVCPMYFSGQSRHFICEMPLLPFCLCMGFNVVCIVFCARRSICICVHWKSSVILLCRCKWKWPILFCGAEGQCVSFVFVEERVFRLGLYYALYYVVCFWWCLFLFLMLF